MSNHLFSSIVSLENLFESWREFRKGKRGKSDVQDFERNLETHLFALHDELQNKTYRHGSYTAFYIPDPKRRHIHKNSRKVLIFWAMSCCHTTECYGQGRNDGCYVWSIAPTCHRTKGC